MTKVWARFLRWLMRSGFNGVFSMVILVGVSVFLYSLFHDIGLRADGKATLFSGLLAGGVVWWQIQVLSRQIAYGTVLEMYKEWNSAEMLKRRRNAWIVEKESPNQETIEDVLEFLEKVSTLERDRYVDTGLIWDTFGWYVGRYFYYCKDVIKDLRMYWTGKKDRTLYCDLEECYGRLLTFEADKRNLEPEAVEEEYHNTKGKFIRAEGADE